MDLNPGNGLVAVAMLCAVVVGLVSRRPVATIVRTVSTGGGGVSVHCELSKPMYGCSRVVIHVDGQGDCAVWGRPDAGAARLVGGGTGSAIGTLKAAGYKVRR